MAEKLEFSKARKARLTVDRLIRSLVDSEFFLRMVAVRREFHRHPGLSGKEVQTATPFRQFLDRVRYVNGIRV